MSAGSLGADKPVRDLDRLAPLFRAAVQQALAECAAAGFDAWVFETYRSPELQALYYERGRTVKPPEKPVTNARSNLYSWHGYGLAVDVISKRHGWNRPASWFESVAKHFDAASCAWGGRWGMKDLPHFQWGRCPASPTDRARDLLLTGGFEAVWLEFGATEPAFVDPIDVTEPEPAKVPAGEPAKVPAEEPAAVMTEQQRSVLGVLLSSGWWRWWGQR